MLPSDLTTLANAKQWLNIATTTDDALLTRMVSAASGFVQAWLNRNIASQAYTEKRDGYGMGAGRRFMVLANRPVISVQSLTIDTIAIPASTDNGQLQPGYGFDDTSIWLSDQSGYSNSFWPSGYYFTRGRRNVVIAYTAGYQKVEARSIPAGSPYTITPFSPWNGDIGAAFTGGAALVLVSGVPATGQYAVSNGVYTFAAADASRAVTITYSYTPFEIEQAVIELIGLRYREKERIGQVSKSIGGEVVVFSQKDFSDDIRTLLQNYKKVVQL